jgi:RNA polymerase sigma-70 factor (ECF subfamily)
LCLAAGLEAPDAEDVCQEVMISALRGLRRYRGCHLSTWLYGITRRRIADHYRSHMRRDVSLGHPGDTTFPKAPTSNPGDVEADVIRSREYTRVRIEIDRLGDPTRSVLLAYYVGEIPVRDIASMMEMPENTVKSHLRRGRLMLRAHLREES